MLNPETPKALVVAPMMAWTDRHCRYLLRLFSPSARLFTEMVTTGALLHGQRWHLLDFHAAEHPVALQLGGNDPQALKRCALEAEALGYDEINLNVGCPSDRVQQGVFGACLMLQPDLVARCVSTMAEAASVPITVKCRLGVDDHDDDEKLAYFIGRIRDAGCRTVYLHARKAILGGLSPAQNRDIPPLQPQRVRHMKSMFPDLTIIMNGGISNLEQVTDHLCWADGVMIGRAAYQNPFFLAECERSLFDGDHSPSLPDIISQYVAYASAQMQRGESLPRLTRHLLHTVHGLPGARRFRRLLSDRRRLANNDLGIIEEALREVAVVC